MTAGDLYSITRLAELRPTILNHLIMIYKMGYRQAIIEQLKKELK